MSHALISSATLNIGETICEINENNYTLIAKIKDLQHYTPAARSSIISFFEKSFDDWSENIPDNLENCFTKSTDNGTDIYTPINSAGKTAKLLWNKNVITALIQVQCPLTSFESLLPAEVEVGLKLMFQTPERFFVCKTTPTTQPKIHIKSARLYVQGK